MQLADYQAYTQSLVALAEADDRIDGLVVLGSTAKTHHQPDQWSDHDFWLIVKNGTEDDFHTDLSWIPQFDRHVLAFRETNHGWKVVFEDGHVLEYAIFPYSELHWARFHHYALLVDKTDISDRLKKMKTTQDENHTTVSPLQQVQFLLSLLVIGMGRYNRGEKLSGLLYIKHHALEQYHNLLQSIVPPQNAHLVDDLSPSRRLEWTHPEYAEKLHPIITASVPDGAELLLDLAVEFADQIDDFPSDAIETVRHVIRYTVDKQL